MPFDSTCCLGGIRYEHKSILVWGSSHFPFLTTQFRECSKTNKHRLIHKHHWVRYYFNVGNFVILVKLRNTANLWTELSWHKEEIHLGKSYLIHLTFVSCRRTIICRILSCKQASSLILLSNFRLMSLLTQFGVTWVSAFTVLQLVYIVCCIHSNTVFFLSKPTVFSRVIWQSKTKESLHLINGNHCLLFYYNICIIFRVFVTVRSSTSIFGS